MAKIRVKVLMGGESDEHDISIMSGNEVIQNLDKEKYEVVTDNPDVVFIALHGRYGEDGTIQKECGDAGVKFTGSGSEACKLGMDKIAFKKFAKDLGIKMPEDVKKAPCVVKPSNNGSSFGVTIVKDQKDLEGAIEYAKKYNDQIMIEEYIEGIEVSSGVVGKGIALPIIEICPKTEFFDYKAKYTSSMCEEIVPARIPTEVAKKIQEISSFVFKKMGCRGYARLDYIIRKNIPYLLEINILPGLTSASLIRKEAAAAGISFSELLDMIVAEAR